MTRMRIDSRLGCLALLFLGIACAMPGIANATFGPKRFTYDMAPDTSPSGTTQTFQVTIKNTTKGYYGYPWLRSANVTAPQGFKVLSASAPGAVVTVSGQDVRLRNMKVAAGRAITATLVVDSTAVSGVWDWGAAAKPTTDFSGSSTFATDPVAPSDPDTEITAPAGGTTVDCPEEAPGATTTTCRLKVTHRALVPGSTTQYYTAALEAVANAALGRNAGALTLELPIAGNIDCLTLSEQSPVTGRAVGPLNRQKVVTFTLADYPGLGAGAPPGLCYGSPTPFVTVGPGAPFFYEGTPFLVGALPDCTSGGVTLTGITPCLLSRRNVGGSWVIETDVPATVPDPTYRG